MKDPQRAKTRARVVITIECQVAAAELVRQPGWRGDALDVLRELVAQTPNPTKLIAQLRALKRVTVVDEKIEVSR